MQKTDDGYQGKGCPCWIWSGQIVCADRWLLLLLSLRVRVENLIKSKLFCQIQHNLTCSEDLCKLGKKYLNTLTYKYYSFSRQNSKTFDITHAILPLTITKLSTCENSLIFGPSYICINVMLFIVMWNKQCFIYFVQTD